MTSLHYLGLALSAINVVFGPLLIWARNQKIGDVLIPFVIMYFISVILMMIVFVACLSRALTDH